MYKPLITHNSALKMVSGEAQTFNFRMDTFCRGAVQLINELQQRGRYIQNGFRRLKIEYGDILWFFYSVQELGMTRG